ncbi:MAG: glycoside hydrolase family 19 protein [Caulobacteraceae bacterium]|nr:MAG: glycoside hydrolase family 19 protein [Caulobacteraceae bacterium]
MTQINPQKFAAFAPNALPGTLAALEAAAAKFKLTDRLVLAHWLGQMHVESKGFSTLTESLNYSVDGLMKTFKRSRISAVDCETFGRKQGRAANQNAIANIVYGGAFGKAQLGNDQPGDGWRFRGGGVKQITGRANYREAGHEADPNVLRTDVKASAEAAANFFVKHRCVAAALTDDVKAVTLLVNGGINGLDDRKVRTAAAKTMLA